MANLPDRLRREIDDFAAGVIMGKAPSLEQHTSALYKAFAPLRDALGGTMTVYRGQPINPPKIDRKWLSWTTEPRMAALFTEARGYQIIEAKVKSSDVVAGILSPNNPNYIEFLVKNRPEYQTRSQKQVPIYYALYMPLNSRFYDDMPENYGDLSDRERLEFEYPDWKRWLKDNERAVEQAGGLVMKRLTPKVNPVERGPFLGVLMPADVKLPPALAALDDAKYGRPAPRYMGKVARHLISGLLKVPPKMLRGMRSWVQSNLDRRPTSRHFPFDLDGWRYLSGVRPEDAEAILKKKHPRGVRVTLSDKKHRFGEARWDDDAWEITIYDTSDLDHALHFVRHEAQHMAQDMLAEITGVSDAGLPKRRIRTPEWGDVDLSKPRFMGPADPHALIDREYQTRLTDSVENYLRFEPHLSPRAYMARDSFFTMLRSFAPKKYRDAVGKFVAEVGRRTAARVASRYAATTPLPPSFPKTEIGLMTMDEFLEYRNPQGKFHEAETWDYDVMRMNRPTESYLGSWSTGRPGEPAYSFSGMRNGVKVSRKPDLLAGVIHNGTLYYSDSRDGRDIPAYYFKNGVEGGVEIRKRKQVKYLSEVLPLISPIAKRNIQEHPNIIQRLIVKGEPMTLRSEDSGRGYAPTLVILNSEDLVVAQASDEWGATLIAVAREYRGRGLGKIIGKRWYELNPSNTSGGFTSAGEANALALWRDRVREFKARGWYSEMIREGRITMDRLREIFKGVEDSKRDLEEFKALYFSEREPEPTKPTGDILVWSDGDTGVIIYDRAFLEDPDDRFIHGYGFLRSSPHTGTYIFSIDYDRPYAEMTTKALMQVARDGGDDRLYDGDGYSDIVEAESIPGVERDGDYLVLTRDLFPLRQESRKEKRLRKSVDPYDEKFYLLQEQAESKWR